MVKVDAKRTTDRVARLYELMSPCRLCPRKCGVDRANGETGYCGIGPHAAVSSFNPHFGEESPLVGRHGSGTIFLAGCNLGCIFCQNYDISHMRRGVQVTVRELVDMMLALEQVGCHNINLVTPTHVVPPLADAVTRARAAGMRVPVVYNCGGYESTEVLRGLDGLVDIYMPDIKYGSNETGGRLSSADDYWDVVRDAVREMHRQVGDLDIDSAGIASRGLLVRHLVMPEGLAGTAAVCSFLATEISLDTYINVMAQYRPMYRASEVPEISRAVTRAEFDTGRSIAHAAGLHRGF